MSGAAQPVARARLARFDDRLNPVLVKEVRQALRGRYFRNLFWLTVVTATVFGVIQLLDAGSQMDVQRTGRVFFQGNFGVFTVAVIGFVPYWAFTSTGAEWDEGTFELLVISNLRPRQLVLGKLAAAAVMTVLFLSAFGPFLVATFVMGGVDLLMMCVLVVGTVFVSLCASALAVGVSSLARTRVARVGLGAAVAAAFVITAIAITSWAAVLLRNSGQIFEREVQLGLISAVAVAGSLGGFGWALGCVRFAHEEENRSTPLRLCVFAMSLAASAIGVVWYAWTGYEQMLAGVGMAQTLVLFLPLVFFATEEDRLGRHVALRIPRSRLAAHLAAPFLPGGGRGILFILLFGVVPTLINLIAATWRGDSLEKAWAVPILALYVLVYIGLPASVLSFKRLGFTGRTGLRVVVGLFVVMSLVLPALLGLILEIRNWTNFKHPGNPIWVAIEMTDPGGTDWPMLIPVTALAVLTVCLNLPRILRGIEEVDQAVEARRARATELHSGSVSRGFAQL